MSNLLSSLRLARGARVIVLALSALAACAETEDALDELLDDAGQNAVAQDSGIPWTPAYPDAAITIYPDAGQSIDSGAVADASSSVDSSTGSDAATTTDAGGFIGGLIGGGDASATDAGWSPPPGQQPDAGTADNPEGWKLNADSYKDCPALPPPIPIIGGLCAGIYFGCGWTSAKGAKYSCTCDWIHWLCI